MFVDAPFAQLAVFLVGQLFAWLYLRTGRFWVGAGATAALWSTLDWWLVARFVLEVPPAEQALPLAMLQGAALATSIAFGWAWLRRRRGRAQRPARFRAAIRQMLADDVENARRSLRGLVWTDPWDAAAWIALGDAERRSGARTRALRCYRRAGAVDTAKHYADLLRHRTDLLQRGRNDASARRVPAPSAADEAKVAAGRG